MLTASHTISTSDLITLPYTTAPVSPDYGQYRNAAYVDVNVTPPYHQNVMCNTAASAYTTSHHVTAPNMSQHTTSQPPSSSAQDATIVSPNRTIFLTKLPYNAVGQAVRRLLEPFGKVERCDVPLDRTSPNKIQGTAIAKFKETNDAARAIKDLDGMRWRGVTISARWDRDSARNNSTGSSTGRPVQARHTSSGTDRVTDMTRDGDDGGARDQRRRAIEGPLIVNGSRGIVAPTRSRHGRREDDSDSSEDDEDDDGSSDGKSVASSFHSQLLLTCCRRRQTCCSSRERKASLNGSHCTWTRYIRVVVRREGDLGNCCSCEVDWLVSDTEMRIEVLEELGLLFFLVTFFHYLVERPQKSKLFYIGSARIDCGVIEEASFRQHLIT